MCSPFYFASTERSVSTNGSVTVSVDGTVSYPSSGDLTTYSSSVASGTNGTRDTTFSPRVNCTRAQIITMLWRMAGEPVVDSINPFTDVDADSYYYNAVLWAVGEEITEGTTATTFSPNKNCTRVGIVTFLYRALSE